MANKKHSRSSKRPLFIALLVAMLLSTVVFAFVGCNTRKAAEPEDEQVEAYPEEQDPPLDEEEKEDEDEKDEEEKEEEEPVKETVAPPATTTPTTPTYTPPPKPKPTPAPSKPVTPTSNASKYGSITITKNGRYSETKTYNNVTIKADSVRLRNKTIKGDLIIHKSVDDDAVITLENVDVKGDIIIDGGYDFRLYDVNAEMIKVHKDSGKVKLSAYDKTEIDDVETYRSIYLKEDDLARGYDGFVNLTTKNSNNIYIEVDLYNCDLEGLYCNDITKVKGLDDNVYIDTVKAYDRVDLGSRVQVDKLTAYESGCTYVSEPDRINAKNGADEPERYRSKDKHSSHHSKDSSLTRLATPTNIRVTYSGGVPTIAWDGVSGTSTYEVTYTVDSTDSKSTSTITVNNATSQPLPKEKATSTQTVTANVKAIGDGRNYKDSYVSNTPSTTITKLTAPNNVKITFDSTDVPTLSWDSVEGAIDYELTYTVNGAEKTETLSNITNHPLGKATSTQTVTASVLAVGNGSSYINSEPVQVTKTWNAPATKLDTPKSVPSIKLAKSTDGMTITATISHTNTGGDFVMEYSIDGGTSYKTYSGAFPITTPCTINARVKQKGDGSSTSDSDYAQSSKGITQLSKLTKAPTISMDVDNNIMITNPYTNTSDVTYKIIYSTDGATFEDFTPYKPTKAGTIYAKVVATSTDSSILSNESDEATFDIVKLAQPTIALNTDKDGLTWSNVPDATSYEVTLNGTKLDSSKVTIGADTSSSSADLSSFVGQKITPIEVVAKADGKLDSPVGTPDGFSQTQLKTPTPSGVAYSGTDLKLTFDADVLDPTNVDYKVTVENDDTSKPDITVGTLDFKTANQINVPVTLTDGKYKVTVTATAKNISVINPSTTGSGSFDVTTP